jgi:hypothetical protein
LKNAKEEGDINLIISYNATIASLYNTIASYNTRIAELQHKENIVHVSSNSKNIILIYFHYCLNLFSFLFC